jgi:hypothetical protein
MKPGGPAIAKQILIYPMPDDRNTVPDAIIGSFAPWSYDDNITGQGAPAGLLGSAMGGPDAPSYGAGLSTSPGSRPPILRWASSTFSGTRTSSTPGTPRGGREH